jgi:hypothetical protein
MAVGDVRVNFKIDDQTSKKLRRLRLLGACDRLHHACRYLHNFFSIDGAPKAMQANIDARQILVTAQRSVLDEAEGLL